MSDAIAPRHESTASTAWPPHHEADRLLQALTFLNTSGDLWSHYAPSARRSWSPHSGIGAAFAAMSQVRSWHGAAAIRCFVTLGPRSSLRSETTFTQQPSPDLKALIEAIDSFVVFWAASEPYEEHLAPYAFRVALHSRAYREALILEETPIERLLQVGPWLPRHRNELPAVASQLGGDDPDGPVHEEYLEQERELVLEALGDSAWDFRSVDGLARATGLSVGRVNVVLSELESLGSVRRPLAPDPKWSPSEVLA